jgi:hypothetical protein
MASPYRLGFAMVLSFVTGFVIPSSVGARDGPCHGWSLATPISGFHGFNFFGVCRSQKKTG